MLDVTERLSVFRPADEAAALTALAEAVWWVTIIDARLVRQYTDIYDAVLADHVAVQRPAIEGTLAGLRFVRNMTSGPVGHVDFIGPPTDPGRHDGVVAAWTWKRVPELSLASLPERVRPWEMTRYRAYKAWLADRTVGEVFERAARFLNLAATRAIPIAESGTFASRQ